jgi:ribosomal protein S12 methylthiotransferase
MVVLVDEVRQKQVVARSSADAPEIDGQAFLPGGREFDAAHFIKVRISAATAHDLQAEPVEIEESSQSIGEE